MNRFIFIFQILFLYAIYQSDNIFVDLSIHVLPNFTVYVEISCERNIHHIFCGRFSYLRHDGDVIRACGRRTLVRYSVNISFVLKISDDFNIFSFQKCTFRCRHRYALRLESTAAFGSDSEGISFLLQTVFHSTQTKDSMVKLTVRDRESIQEAVRRFRKLVERSGIKKEMRRREFFEKPSETKRRARLRAERRMKRNRLLGV